MLYNISLDDITFLFFILARITGLFLISPLLNSQSINTTVRVTLTVFITLLIAMAIYPDYRGENARFHLIPENASANQSLLMIVLTLIKELGIGYLIGFCFTILFEALVLAGQLVSTNIGLSMAEVFDPATNASQPTLTQFFTITASLLILVLDLHHTFFEVAADSFFTIPVGNYNMPYEMLKDLTAGTSTIFSLAIKFAAIPLVVLLLVTVGLGIMAKVMPELNILAIAFPVKILIGYVALIGSMTYFPLLLQQAFVEYQNLAGLLVQHIGNGGK